MEALLRPEEHEALDDDTIVAVSECPGGLRAVSPQRRNHEVLQQANIEPLRFRIRLASDEGGLNLNMPPATIDRLDALAVEPGGVACEVDGAECVPPRLRLPSSGHISPLPRPRRDSVIADLHDARVTTRMPQGY